MPDKDYYDRHATLRLSATHGARQCAPRFMPHCCTHRLAFPRLGLLLHSFLDDSTRCNHSQGCRVSMSQCRFLLSLPRVPCPQNIRRQVGRYGLLASGNVWLRDIHFMPEKSPHLRCSIFPSCREHSSLSPHVFLASSNSNNHTAFGRIIRG